MANARSDNNMTALMIASGEGHLNIVKYLVEKGADVHACNNSNLTALMIASGEGYLEVVKYLVEKGADVHARSNTNLTALMIASGEGHLEVVKYLVEKGADVHARSNNNLTALMFASLKGHAEVSTYLGSQARKRKRDDNNVDERETSRPRYTGREESQHFTNSSSSSNGGNEFDIKAIWKTNLFPIDNPKPLLSTIYKKKQIDVELFMVDNKTGIAFYHDDPEMDYKLTVNFKITGNKLDAELVIMESEKVFEEELCASPPKYEKPKRHCPKCQDASRYKNQMAK